MKRSAVVLTLAGAAALMLAAPDFDPVQGLTDNRAVAADRPFWLEGEPGRPPGKNDSFADLAEKLGPAVVSIQVEKVVEDIPGMLRPFFEGQQRRQPRRRLPVAGGSGFV